MTAHSANATDGITSQRHCSSDAAAAAVACSSSQRSQRATAPRKTSDVEPNVRSSIAFRSDATELCSDCHLATSTSSSSWPGLRGLAAQECRLRAVGAGTTRAPKPRTASTKRRPVRLWSHSPQIATIVEGPRRVDTSSATSRRHGSAMRSCFRPKPRQCAQCSKELKAGNLALLGERSGCSSKSVRPRLAPSTAAAEPGKASKSRSLTWTAELGAVLVAAPRVVGLEICFDVGLEICLAELSSMASSIALVTTAPASRFRSGLRRLDPLAFFFGAGCVVKCRAKNSSSISVSLAW
mmetsp:Transcript_34646/g.62849  ORF Transcript_34646/g.62849 Transcript_34646/m.62849 type:complete len:296 (-) Transcript_34646:787-1674(-)